MVTIIFFVAQLASGYLTVTADREGLTVFVDDDSIGVTPIIRYELKPDEYDVGFFPQDSIEQASWRLKNGSINAIWKIAKYGEGIVKVRIEPGRETVVELSYAAVAKAPGKAKMKVFGCLGGTFILGVLLTLAVQAIF
jgi:hypothetical protein